MSLSKNKAIFADAKIRSGQYANASEMLRASLRALPAPVLRGRRCRKGGMSKLQRGISCGNRENRHSCYTVFALSDLAVSGGLPFRRHLCLAQISPKAHRA
jgi:Arc/MetJ-type ribon-helix-helix transcriptional regulator